MRSGIREALGSDCMCIIGGGRACHVCVCGGRRACHVCLCGGGGLAGCLWGWMGGPSSLAGVFVCVMVWGGGRGGEGGEHAAVPACLPACAHPPACLPACLPAIACLPRVQGCLPVYLPACLPRVQGCLPACLPACRYHVLDENSDDDEAANLAGQPSSRSGQQQQQQQQATGHGYGRPHVDADVTAANLLSAPPPPPHTHVYEEADADQLDADDCVYDDMEPPQQQCLAARGPPPACSSSSNGNGVKSTARSNGGGCTQAPPAWHTGQGPHHSLYPAPDPHHGPYPDPDPGPGDTWHTLLERLMHAAGQLHYGLLGDVWADGGAEGACGGQQGIGAQGCVEGVRQDGGPMAALLQLLRTMGVHRAAHELQPLMAVYVDVLAARLAAVPADMGVLAQLWEATGLAGAQAGTPLSPLSPLVTPLAPWYPPGTPLVPPWYPP